MSSRSSPIKNLTKQLTKHDAFFRANLSKISAFYLKLIVQEPFRAYENFKYSRKIEEHQLKEDPIFIIGHWRSGTSFLQYLLGQDSRFGYINKFQVVFPDVFLSTERFLKRIINSIPKSINLLQDAQNMSINLELESPSEIEIALTTMISPTSLHWGHIFPNDAWMYFNKYLFFDTANKDEIEKWKNDYHHLIKKTSFKNNGRRLLIKNPGNTGRINKLLEIYPDAQFIFIHRNPYDVYYSNKKLWNTLLNNLGLQDFDKLQIEDEIINVYKKLMRRYLKQRMDIPRGQLAEVRFEDLVSQPVSEIWKIYEQLDLDNFKKAKPYFNLFLDQKAKGKSSDYRYENHIMKKINRNWRFAFKQWNYSVISSRKVAQIP